MNFVYNILEISNSLTPKFKIYTKIFAGTEHPVNLKGLGKAVLNLLRSIRRAVNIRFAKVDALTTKLTVPKNSILEI